MTLGLDLAAELWLAEPDAEIRKRAAAAGVGSDATAEELAGAYTALFVLNVYPYGSIFTDHSAELNGVESALWARRVEQTGFRPAQAASVGAPDHVGLCLAYLHHLEARGVEDPGVLSRLLSWIPICALAAERDPLAHEFYRQLSRETRKALLERCGEPGPETAVEPRAGDPESGALEGSGDHGELRLSDILSFLLAPARCGFFLSRSSLARIGRRASLPVAFGGRRETARGLFEEAGESGRVEALLEQLEGHAGGWEATYARTAAQWPAWAPWAELWLARLARCRSALADLRATVRDFEPSLSAEGARERGGAEEA